MTDQHGSFSDSDPAAEMPNEPFDTSASRSAQGPTEVEEEPALAAEPGDPGDALGDVDVLTAQLAERTLDLQRVQAEFVNYKRRVERDRDLIRENATYAVLAPITEVLDTIDRAREHAERDGQSLEGGLKAIAEQLERIVSGLGLTKFGTPGDPFDPAIHDALSHIGEDPEVDVTTCKVVAKAGYRIGDRVVRAAQVLVVDPVAGSAPTPAEQPDDEVTGDGPAGDGTDDQGSNQGN